MSPAHKRIEEAQHDEATTQMLLEIRKRIVEETVSMNPAFDYDRLDEEVAQALLHLSHYGERHREHLTRYARSRANRFVWVSGWK
jgi:transposase-like protein